MRLFKDEQGHLITEQELRQEFGLLKLIDPDSYDYSFENYIRNCTEKKRNAFRIKKEIKKCLYGNSGENKGVSLEILKL